MHSALPPEASALVDRERTLLARLSDLVSEAGEDDDRRTRLREMGEQLDQLFLLVVTGEFNAGKSSVLNALFGEKLMEEGPVPTTDKITVLRYAEEEGVHRRGEHLVERTLASPILRNLRLVDTPGTNSIIQEHQRLTEEFIPRADLVLFVTSFDRPLTESERQFLSFLREDWGKELVCVINKADLARRDGDLEQVVKHVRDGFREQLGIDPPCFPVSAELAYEAKMTESESARQTLWEKSGYEPFETFVRERLSGAEQIRRKLLAPLESASALLGQVERDLTGRRKTLRHDSERADDLAERIERAREELANGYQRYLAEIDQLLEDMERRGVRFLDDALRLGRLDLLRDRDRFKEEFNRQVVRDTQQQLEERITEATDWLTERALGLWNELHDRFQEASPSTDGPARSDFQYNRADVFRRITDAARQQMQRYDVEAEARRTLENARSAADIAQYAGIGAAGLGILSGALIAATALDVVGGFGLATSGVLAAAGLTVLPRQRRKAKEALREEVEALRSQVRTALTKQFEHQIDAALGRADALLGPLREFVETERTRLKESEREQSELRDEIDALRSEVQEIG